MTKKDANDYLQDGIYGTKLPKQGERDEFLGTLRERVVLALTIGQVMTDKGIEKLEEDIKFYPNAKLSFNGAVDSKFFKSEKEIAKKYNITYTTVLNKDAKTNIGLVLYCGDAIDKEEIFYEEQKKIQKEEHQKESNFFKKMFNWFKC